MNWLVGIDDLGNAMASEGLLEDLAGMTGLQRDGHFVGQHLAAGHVHDGGEIDEASRHRNVGGVQRPDLIGTADDHLAQQVGIDLVLPMPLTGARLRAQGLDAHAQHQCAQVTAAYEDALASQHAAKHPGTHERVLQVQFVNSAHECQVGIAGRPRLVVDRASADLKQLGLAHYAKETLHKSAKTELVR